MDAAPYPSSDPPLLTVPLRPILSFSGVTLESDDGYDTSMWDVTFNLGAGELALVRLEPTHRRLPLADAAQGLIDPTEGAVSFAGEDWGALTEIRAAAQRGNIGRVFDGGGWISNLDVDENISLAQRHHTARTPAEIATEAAALARTFGLPGLPRGRPTTVRPQDLQRAALVRAFLGRPQLLILESPTVGVYPDVLPALLNAVRGVRARGAAVLWTTLDAAVWNEPAVRPTLRCVMTGSQMIVQSAGDAERTL